MLSTTEAKTALEQAQQRLEALKSQLPHYQQDAAETALRVAQAKAAKVERKALAKLMTEASAAAELHDQHEQDLEAATLELEAAARHLELARRYEEIEGLAKHAARAARQWHDEALTINNLLELAERNAVSCGEALRVILESRIMLSDVARDLSRGDAATIIAELQKHCDLSPLLLHWPNSPATSLDGFFGEGRQVLVMPGIYKNLIWGLLAITAQRHGLPSLDQTLEIPFLPVRAQRRSVEPTPEPAPTPRHEPKPKPEDVNEPDLEEEPDTLDTLEPSDDNTAFFGKAN
jgi:hypothetical protein